MKFCKHVEQLYGANVITPNMHMHLHLKENLLDYGPVYAFWLFSFERYNGILGKSPTNNHNIESQLLEHFIEDNYILSSELPSQFQCDFLDCLKSFHEQVDFNTQDSIHFEESMDVRVVLP